MWGDRKHFLATRSCPPPATAHRKARRRKCPRGTAGQGRRRCSNFCFFVWIIRTACLGTKAIRPSTSHRHRFGPSVQGVQAGQGCLHGRQESARGWAGLRGGGEGGPAVIPRCPRIPVGVGWRVDTGPIFPSSGSLEKSGIYVGTQTPPSTHRLVMNAPRHPPQGGLGSGFRTTLPPLGVGLPGRAPRGIYLYRELHPTMLKKKDRGKFHDPDNTLGAFGAPKVRDPPTPPPPKREGGGGYALWRPRRLMTFIPPRKGRGLEGMGARPADPPQSSLAATHLGTVTVVGCFRGGAC